MATTKKNELAVLNQKDALPLIAALDKKLQAMEQVRTTSWKTNGNISEDFPDIREERDNTNLIKALSVVRVRATAYNEAAESSEANFGMSLKAFPVWKHNGFTLEEWHHDIVLRYKINNQEETEQKIKKHRDALKEFVSKEERKANAIKEIINDFGEDILKDLA